MVEYKIIIDSNLVEFQSDVQHHIKQGWALVGGPFMAPPGYAQAVTRTRPEELDREYW